ncbi:T-cell differentiation antigen CD6-like [Trichomycterus rosablanca]|uniref:T-cell differentiation antigen CD6-like n=1 Tax=Trichomycterus rosablanca TaxID=2290929 RepID=UPI002F35C2E3
MKFRSTLPVMEAFKILLVLQAVAFCQGKLYIHTASEPCSWAVASAEENLSLPIFTDQSLYNLAAQICQASGCGEVYELHKSSAPSNASCLTNCIYHNKELINCSQTLEKNCSILSEVVCGNHQVRLVGGGYHHCAGRVELWHAGQWGTVCDDEWDKQDADVMCAQHGCGYALSVTGQEGPYSHGKGPILMDELNCTGTERSLWECPALPASDCGHKEDAGVVCSEYKDLRLTGGLDRCSGRVEIHRNGSWGTVCDTCWDKEEATMACKMLGCGGVKQFKYFQPKFMHTNETRWYFQCGKEHNILWDCKEYSGIKFILCKDTAAAGLICNGSLGLPLSTSPNPSPAMETTQMTPTVHEFMSLELLACILLSGALLIAIVVNIILCCSAKKRKGHTVEQQFTNLQNTPQVEDNTYRDSVHLVKLTNSENNHNTQIMPPPMWTQSSVESDTDYEPSECSQSGPFPLSTFRNSMRYMPDRQTSPRNETRLQILTEEVDSFESSSTSSGEIYENTGQNVAGLLNDYTNTGEDRSDLQCGGMNMESSDGEDPIYSPVTAETESYNFDNDDYDDVAHLTQTPMM